MDGEKITLSGFIDKWFVDYAEKQLAPKTIERYKVLLKRINISLGHIKLAKLQPNHLLSFYSNLSEGGIRNDYKYTLNLPYYDEITNNKPFLVKDIGLSSRTINNLLSGNTTTAPTAQKIADALNISLNKLFTPKDIEKGLSDRTILHHHRLLSSVLNTAVQWQLIDSNPASRIKAPKVENVEPEILDDNQVVEMLLLLEHEPLKYQVAVHIAVLGGLRLGEVVGLKWGDVDFDSGSLIVSKARQYTKEKGNFEKTTKNPSSHRTIKLPKTAINKLDQLKRKQNIQRKDFGDLWVESGNIFIQADGSTMFPTTPTHWFRKWIKKTDLPKITFHQLRHTSASLLIAKGVDIITVSKRLGHARPSTTTDIYGHTIAKMDTLAADMFDDMINQNDDGN